MVSQTNNKYHDILSNYYDYKIDDNSEKYTSYGYRLIEIINELVIPTSTLSYIKDMNYHDANNQRTVDYIVSRVINIGHYNRKIYTDDTNEYERVLLEKLKDFLDLEKEMIYKIFILTKKICLNYDLTEPTQKQKNSIRSEAKRKRHRCYICGRLLDADKQTDNKNRQIAEKKEKGNYEKNLLEIEHILPRTYGGGLNKENLTVACEHCNKIKDDKLSYANCYFENFICNSDTENSIRSKLTKDIKFSILYKQNFQCKICEKKLYELDIENIYFYKKEENESYHFTNVIMCCEECQELYKIKGVKNGLYL
ncbi:MAG TPA: HNH endonuclease [Campylobacterales bacterium]|nr:HNH endonuclease [Campylobacterales bacterium]